jgi:hypothetical protein
LPLDVRKDFATVTNLIAQRRFAEADALVTGKWLGRGWKTATMPTACSRN